jgi:hypothetical protein
MESSLGYANLCKMRLVFIGQRKRISLKYREKCEERAGQIIRITMIMTITLIMIIQILIITMIKIMIEDM